MEVGGQEAAAPRLLPLLPLLPRPLLPLLLLLPLLGVMEAWGVQTSRQIFWKIFWRAGTFFTSWGWQRLR